MQAIRFTQSTRKHRIGRAHVLHVMETYEPTDTVSRQGEPALRWVGADERGVPLEVVAVVMPDYLLVIHVMPQYRGGTP